MHSKVRDWWHEARYPFFLFLALLPAVLVAGTHFGQRIEGDAVEDITLHYAYCDGKDAIAEFGLLKRRGKYVSMTMYLEDKDAFPRRTKWIDIGDQPEGAPASKPARIDYQALGPFRIIAGCGHSVTIFTEHRSEIGWWMMHGEFGPFGPIGVDEPT